MVRLQAAVLLAPCAALLPRGIWPPGLVPSFDDAEMSRERFDELVVNGSAFVVRGTGKSSGLWGWDCDTFKKDKTFRGAHGQLSYGSKRGLAVISEPWEDLLQPSGAEKLDDQAPMMGSLYFGIKDIQFEDAESPLSWTSAMLLKIQDLSRVPSYMDPRNLWRLNPEGISELDSLHSSPEFWMSAPSAGAQAHMDSHVSNTFSLQLSGRKRWRLSQPPPHEAVRERQRYGDGMVYRRKPPWVPAYDLVLEPGDALFFPPGTLHETSNPGTVCAASITYQFSVPMAARYYRDLIRRFRRCGDLRESWPLMKNWANLEGVALPSGGLNLEGLVAAAAAGSELHSEFTAHLRDALHFVDANFDGVATSGEAHAAAEELRQAAWADTAKKPAPPKREKTEL